MGVEINLMRIKPSQNPDDETYADEGFERSLLPHEVIKFKYDEMQEIAEITGCSYSSYSKFRDWLSVQVFGVRASVIHNEAENLKQEEPYQHPLYHIINFSDCDGYIGPAALKELLPALKNISPVDRNDWFEDVLRSLVVALDERNGDFENVYLKYS